MTAPAGRVRPPGRVRERRAFEALGASKARGRHGPVRVTWAPPIAADERRIAMAVPRRAGTAVVRNRIRRRLREACRAMPLPPGDYLLTASAPAATMAFPALCDAVRRAVSAAVPREGSSRPGEGTGASGDGTT